MQQFNRSLMGMAGIICLIAGLVMVLMWWNDVAVLFRGGGGIVLAVTGMILLSAFKR